mmetsp:Transcript_23575/g.33753  ORF Transcript_23575/g.33753 Transcript_23575/m.33753 type:complete len:108 (-) Transcript_23575:218-541(-)
MDGLYQPLTSIYSCYPTSIYRPSPHHSPHLINSLYLGSSGQQQADHFLMTSSGCHMQWGITIRINSLCLGSSGQQLPDRFLMTFNGCQMQWGTSTLIDHIWANSLVK